MQAASKAVTFGATSIVLSAALHFQDADVVARCLLVCVFLFVTIPAASHLIARAAYRSREPLAPETQIDELAERSEDPSS
jgi:multicomponent Na+:H+ antiporter subunit G